MGVIASSRIHPQGSQLPPWRWPACTWKAASDDGEVLTSAAKPNCALLVAGTGGLSLLGRRGVLEVARQAGPILCQRGGVGRHPGGRASAVSEEACVRRRNAAERKPRGGSLVEVVQGLLGLGLGHGVRGRAAVDEYEAGQTLDSGLAVEVPGGVGGGDRPAGRMTADAHVAALLLRHLDSLPQILDLHVHAPLLRELALVVGDRLHVVGDAVIREPAK